MQRDQPIPECVPQSRVFDVQFTREQQHGHRRVRRDLIQLRANQRLQPFDRRLGPLQRRSPSRRQQNRDMIRNGNPHLCLGGKMPEDGRLRHPDFGRDGASGDPVRPDPVRKIKDRCDDLGFAE